MDPTVNRDIVQVIMNLDTVPPSFNSGNTYESIIFPEGYEKPSKEAFEAKLKEYIDAKPDRELRLQRGVKLTTTDFLMVSDFPFPSDAIRQAWKTYRQALRDITATTTPSFDENSRLVVTWPTPPIWPANVV
jgi:hypothetical protein